MVRNEPDQSLNGAIANVVSILESQNQRRSQTTMSVSGQNSTNMRWRGVEMLAGIQAACVLSVPTDGNELRPPPEEPAYVIFCNTKAGPEEKLEFPWQNSME